MNVGHQATPPDGEGATREFTWVAVDEYEELLRYQASENSLRVRLERDEFDGGWVVSVVELPGCMSEGETVGEALRNIADAYEGVTNAE